MANGILRRFGRELLRSPFIQECIKGITVLVDHTVGVLIVCGSVVGLMRLSASILGYNLRETLFSGQGGNLGLIAVFAVVIVVFVVFISKLCCEFWAAWKQVAKK